jgi:hypothetical protein
VASSFNTLYVNEAHRGCPSQPNTDELVQNAIDILNRRRVLSRYPHLTCIHRIGTDEIFLGICLVINRTVTMRMPGGEGYVYYNDIHLYWKSDANHEIE